MSANSARAVERPPMLDVRANVSARAWDGYVASHPDASAHHAAAWAGLVERAFGHRTRYLAACEGDRITGVLPLVLFDTPLFGRFGTSMPFLNYGGILADTAEAADALLTAAKREVESIKGSYLELRHTRRLFDDLPVKTHKVSMILPLQTTVDAQWGVLDRKLRNQVRKAEKSGLTTQIGGVELLDWFYPVLARNMRDLGSPVHSRRFFREIMTTFPDRARILCVSLGAVPIAASFTLSHGTRLEVPWASAIRTYNSLCPNVLLYWEMLKFAIGGGFSSFDFGRSTPLEGTYQFKSQWGAQPLPLYWEYWMNGDAELPDRSPKNPKFGWAISMWRRMPVAMSSALGPFIVRNIP